MYKRLQVSRDLECIVADAAPNIQASNVDTDLLQITLPRALQW